MAETLTLTANSKEEIYQEIFPQLESILGGETDLIANMANLSAVLMEAFGHLWIGFYLVRPVEGGAGAPEVGEQLVLGPFQGPLACTRIRFGRGVCGTAWKNAATLIVPDVEQFPGHIACSSLSRSEIVVPVFKGCGNERKVAAVLDIDSVDTEKFDEVDRYWLEKIVKLICI